MRIEKRAARLLEALRQRQCNAAAPPAAGSVVSQLMHELSCIVELHRRSRDGSQHRQNSKRQTPTIGRAPRFLSPAYHPTGALEMSSRQQQQSSAVTSPFLQRNRMCRDDRRPLHDIARTHSHILVKLSEALQLIKLIKLPILI